MAAKTPSRPARGSYAPLICLNCRARKIKCHLPSLDIIQPSDSPQPPDRACQRCQNLALECIVQKTILGRPAARRNRSRATTSSGSTALESSLATDTDDQLPAGGGIEDYLLSHVADVASPEQSTSQRPVNNSTETFEALTSSACLLSVLLSRDRRFAATVPTTVTSNCISVVRLVSSGLAALLDENLAWLRFYIPSAPRLTVLRELVARSESASVVKSFDSQSALLFALLSLIALDAPSSRLRQDRQLYHNLQIVVSQYGQIFLFSPSKDYQTLLILELLINWRPTAMISHQSAAATSVKGELYISLACRVAEKIDIGDSEGWFLGQLNNPHQINGPQMETMITQSLLWCHSVMNIAVSSGHAAKMSSLAHRLLSHIKFLALTIPKLLQVHPQLPNVTYSFHRLRVAFNDIQQMMRAKRSWRDMDQLADIIDEHENACILHQNQIHELLIGPSTKQEFNDHVAIATALIESDLQQSRTRISGMALFYTMMSQLKPDNDPNDIQPDEATQISEQVIKSLKDVHIGKGLEAAEFLSRYGDEREMRMNDILTGFIDASKDLKLDGIPFLPPPGTVALEILSFCRQIVENNAARMKGWGGLHPDVGRHLDLFDGCARRLETMSAPDDCTPEQAFARGSLYAACAKLIRGLHSIVAKWIKQLAASEEADREASQMTWTYVESASTQSSSGSYFDPLTDIDFDELFGQWANWPQTDFSQMILD